MKNKLSQKKYNRNTITVTTDAIYSMDAFNKFKYDKKETELIHDTLQVLLNSPNPLSSEYGFDALDFEFIAQFRARQQSLIDECSFFLKKCKEEVEEE